HVVVEPVPGSEPAVYPKELYAAEVRIARRIRGMVEREARPDVKERLAANVGKAIETFESKIGVELAPAQREAVDLVAHHRVVVVTGGPGVGKTTIVRAIL